MSVHEISIECEVEEYGKEGEYRATLKLEKWLAGPAREVTFLGAKSPGEAFGRALLLLAVDVIEGSDLGLLARELADTVSEYDEDGGEDGGEG